MDIILVLIVFSIVQSIFGVGLLLFGTPTLLLFGIAYEDALWSLLPSSVAISMFQVRSDSLLIKAERNVYILTVPALIIGMIVVLSYDDYINIGKIVGFFLLVIGVIRSFHRVRELLRLIIAKNIELYCFVMGFIHGISNMGGGALTVLMSTLYKEKKTIRVNIAYTYLLFGVFQLAILLMIGGNALSYANIMLHVMVSLVSYYLVDSTKLMEKIDDLNYQFLITLLILFYGTLPFVV